MSDRLTCKECGGVEVCDDDCVRALTAEVERLRQENERLRRAEAQLSEDCTTDEVHCSCVPTLQAEVKRLKMWFEKSREDQTEILKEKIRRKQENERLRGALERIAATNAPDDQFAQRVAREALG